MKWQKCRAANYDKSAILIEIGEYSGYAPAAPEVYAAGVSFEGPSNLVTLLDAIPPYWEFMRKKTYEAVGDPTTAEGKAQLERQSPLFAAARIRAPLRVNQVESDQIVIALREHGTVDVRTLQPK